MILVQHVPANVLAKLSETHIAILNAHLEAELLKNDTIKQALAGPMGTHLKGLGH
ncbi:MAG TPA: hypothetical protein VIX89_03195 [Bryobacteraceae bacterium]